MQEQAREGSLALDSISHVQELVGPPHLIRIVFDFALFGSMLTSFSTIACLVFIMSHFLERIGKDGLATADSLFGKRNGQL
mgnify:CR=1 FL=1